MSLAIKRLVIATGNAGKLAEFRALLAPLGIEVVGQHELGIPDAEETGLTFAENAILKARHAAQLSGLPALADDSGLCVDALGGAPGLYSARYAGPGADAQANIDKLLQALSDVDVAERAAHFVCSLALMRSALDPDPILVSGRWFGRILPAPRGSGGFGYDPVFFDESLQCSAADLAPQEKQRVSHRGQAINELLHALHERRLQS